MKKRIRREKLSPSSHEIANRERIFRTVYSENGGSYGGEIEARSRPHAEILAAKRGLNERILFESSGRGSPNFAGIGELLLKQHRSRKDTVRALHEACFLGFIGLQSGTLTARDLLGDGGLIHGIAHLLNGTDDVTPVGLAKMARDLEGRVPGWPGPAVPQRQIRKALNNGR